MQTVLPSEFKRGMVLMLEGAAQVLEGFHIASTAQTRHKLHCRLRNLKSGRLSDHVFGDSDRVPVAELATHRVSFSYQQGDTFVFIDAETFEELSLSTEQIGDRKGFLKENGEYKALFLEGKLLDIVLPPAMTLQVVETAPPVRGGSDSAWKEARLDTGLRIMVPIFIAQGEFIRVDTSERKYAGKESAEKK